ncbi:hypothetical protein Tco_1107615 [Tanacetum coccineum]
MSTILALSYPSSNNQLETSSNPMHQVAMPERQTLSCVDNTSKSNDDMARKYTHSNTVQHAEFFKQKMLLVQLQEAGIQLSKDQLAVLADTGERIDFSPVMVPMFSLSKDNVLDSCEQSIEIDRLKQILSEHVKEKESLMQTVTLLKNDFKKEESRNIDREIALEKKIKELDNIVFKRDQSAQTVHMLTKPQFFYDHTTKQALGFQNPFYLKKAQQLEPKIYGGNVIKNTSSIVILDSKETLMLAERVSSMNSSEPTYSCRPTKVEVPKELPKVSMVNTSLKKLKHHLVGFDVVVKERTIATTITEGMWGFEHTKACFRDEIIPFVKALKDLFNTFDQYLIDEISKVQNVFHQMERVMEQHRLESKTFKVKMIKVLNENERLLEQVISKDIVIIIVNSYVDNDYEIFQRDNFISNQGAPSFDQYFEINELKAQSQEKDTVIIKLKERIKSLSGKMNEDKIKKDLEEIETINIELDHMVSKLIAKNEHLKQTYKQLYDSVKPIRVRSKEQCDALVNQVNQKSVEISDLNASLQEKVLVITALKNELRKLKGKGVIACRESVNKPKVIAPVVHKEDLEPFSPKLKNNREAHVDYIRITKENADTLRDIVEQARTLNPLDNALAYACMYTKQIQELLVYVSDTCPSSPSKSEKLVAVTPMNKARKVTFAKTSTTSDNNTQIQVDVHQTQTTNKPLVPSTNEKCSTNASRSKP